MKKITFCTLILAFTLLTIGKVNAQDIIDLTMSDDPNVLVDTLDGIPDGAVVLLKPGMTYNAGSFAFDSSVTIMNSEPLNLDRPKIDCDDNFKFAEGTTIDSIKFINLELFGDYDGHYILNSDKSIDSIGSLELHGCYIHDLRGVVRMKGDGPGVLNELLFDNCFVNRIRDYGILTVDVDTWKCNNIVFTNSTFSKTRGFITSRNASESLLIENCTFNETPAAGQRMFRWRNSAQDSIRDGIMVKNTLWGTGWDETGTGETGYDAYDGLSNTTWTFENTYITSDLDIADGKDSIEGFNFVYAGASTDLWVSTSADSLQFADEAFAGIGNAGDQRWAVGTDAGGIEMNISHPAYATLGTLDATKKVAGLTIHANSAKAVTIDDNNKTVGEMSFTQRLKLGGSGSFDDDGLPAGRVLTFDLDHSATVNVAAMSSSSGSDRVLNVAVGDKDNLLGEHTALGASLTMSSFEYKGAPTTVMLYSPSSGVNVYYVSTDFLANNDSLLSDLSVSVGDLDPVFSPEVDAYTLLVPDGTTEVIVTGTTNDPNATVTDPVTVDVSGGSGTATITCVAEDGVADMVYTVTITVEAPPPTPADITFIVDDTDLRASPGFALKGSWNTATGEYDVGWSDGAEHSVFYDDGTNGDATAGDNIWTVTLQLIPDGGVNTWEWGVNDVNSNWIDGNWQFTVSDETAQSLAPYVIVSIDQVDANNFSIYPNPASSIVYIDNAEQINKVEVISLSGKQLLNEVNKGGTSLTLSVDGLASGVYVMRLTDINYVISHKKLIVE